MNNKEKKEKYFLPSWGFYLVFIVRNVKIMVCTEFERLSHRFLKSYGTWVNKFIYSFIDIWFVWYYIKSIIKYNSKYSSNINHIDNILKIC